DQTCVAAHQQTRDRLVQGLGCMLEFCAKGRDIRKLCEMPGPLQGSLGRFRLMAPHGDACSNQLMCYAQGGREPAWVQSGNDAFGIVYVADQKMAPGVQISRV